MVCAIDMNRVGVKNPNNMSWFIKKGYQLLPLLFYMMHPKDVDVKEEAMTKYNSQTTRGLNLDKNWKIKFVVIG